jgi:putative protease
MKKLITLHDVINLEMVLKHVDGILVGQKTYGTRLTHSFSDEELHFIIDEVIHQKKDVFLMANQMMTDEQLEQFSTWIEQFKNKKITGVVVADLGAIITLNEKGFLGRVIYNPETLATNYYDFNDLSRLDVFGVYAAKEITLSDLDIIGSQKKIKMFIVGHGHLNMFYSKRQLIHNYMEFLGEPSRFHDQKDLTLIEENRQEEAYPILEDDAGTHVFRSHVMHVMNHLDELKEWLDYMVIDTLFKDDRYGALVAQMYDTKDVDLIKRIQEDYHEMWDEGFFYKKTIYKGKGGEQ